ncbi:hypothetical protein ACFWFF_30640 [Streptomyces sp. NPDC060223]|uniref:hypothetical protein n=1 Tax=Streptomyces sp. NPDC060223 TaxID=3347077 RepID=UPI00365D9349
MAWTSCIPSVPAPLLRHFAEAATTKVWPVAGAGDGSDPLSGDGFSSPGSGPGSTSPGLGVDACDGACAVGDVTPELAELG